MMNSEIARVTKGIVAETKCEAGIARELSADPAYAARAEGNINISKLSLNDRFSCA